MRETKSSALVSIFNVDRQKTRVIVNSNGIILEPDNKPTHPTVIPMHHVAAVRPCFCKKIKQIYCDCIIGGKDENLDYHLTDLSNMSNPESQLSSETSMTIQPPPSGLLSSKLMYIRVYYATPRSDGTWKINFHCLANVDLTDAQINDWITTVDNIINEFLRPKRFIVFINPFGGKRRGPQIFNKKIMPILKMAGCQAECIITQRANHARDTILDPSFPIFSYDGLVCVGGDGIFSEILNGIIVRTQIDNGVQYGDSQSVLEKPSIVLGIIPAGSTDAMAFAVCGNNDPITSAIHMVLGNRVNVDVSSVHSTRDGEKLIRFATGFLGYGFFGDVMVESEKYRWMGPKRYDWAGFKKLMSHHIYQGELKLHVSTGDGSPRDKNPCSSNCAQCAKSALRCKYNSSMGLSDLPTDEESRIAIKGQFLAINAAIMSCKCKASKKGMAPAAHLGNGCADLVVVSKCSRFDYLKFVTRLASAYKSPFDLDYVNVYRVKEFEFVPTIKAEGSGKSYNLSDASVWNCDGELIAEPALKVKVHCQLVSCFGYGLDYGDFDRSKSTNWLPSNRIQDMSNNLVNTEVIS